MKNSRDIIKKNIQVNHGKWWVEKPGKTVDNYPIVGAYEDDDFETIVYVMDEHVANLKHYGNCSDKAEIEKLVYGRKGYVYLLQDAKNPELMKLGYSKNPLARSKQIGGADLIKQWEVSNALTVEQYLHKMLNDCQLRDKESNPELNVSLSKVKSLGREWYHNLTSDIIDAIIPTADCVVVRKFAINVKDRLYTDRYDLTPGHFSCLGRKRNYFLATVFVDTGIDIIEATGYMEYSDPNTIYVDMRCDLLDALHEREIKINFNDFLDVLDKHFTDNDIYKYIQDNMSSKNQVDNILYLMNNLHTVQGMYEAFKKFKNYQNAYTVMNSQEWFTISLEGRK